MSKKIMDLRDDVKYSLADYINILDIKDNIIFLEDMTVSFILKISFIYDEILSDEEIVDIKNREMNFLNALDPKLSVRIYFKKDKNLDNIKEDHLKTNKSEKSIVKELFLQEINQVNIDLDHNFLFNYSLYVEVRKKTNISISNPKNLIYSDQKINENQRTEILNVINSMKEIENKFSLYFEKAGHRVTRLSEQEVIDLIGSHINFQPEKDIKFINKEDLISSDLNINFNFLRNSNKYVRFVTIKREPEFVYPTIIKYLCRADLNFEYDIILNIKMKNKYDEQQKLKRKKRIARALKFDFLSDDVDEEKQIEEENISNLLVEMVSGKENLFDVEVLILVKGDSLEQLNQNTEDILSSVKQLEGAEGFKECNANFKLFLDSIPGMDAKFDNYRHFKFRTSYLADLLPIFGPPEGSGNPLMLLRNKYNALTYVDPMNEKYVNKNGIVMGMSGSGKSFLMNNISLSYLAFDPLITIVDKGGSYKKFIESLEGDYFEVSPEYKINPFSVPINEQKQDLFWLSILQTMIKDNDDTINNDEKIVLEEAIAIIRKKEIYNPIIDDFLEAIEELNFNSDIMKSTQDKIFRYLKRWTRGVYGDFFNNKESNIDVSNDIIGFDLKNLENYTEILEVFMYFISSICWYKAELDRDRKKLFIFDEVWALFLTKQGGQLLMEMYRTLRKYGASIWSISQDISDFSNSEYSAAILQNISFYYILQQSDGSDYDKLAKVLNLSKENILEIRNMQSRKGYYSEMFIKTPDLKFVARLVTSSYKYWLATTDSADIVAYSNMLKEVEEKRDVFMQLAMTYPFGAVNV